MAYENPLKSLREVERGGEVPIRHSFDITDDREEGKRTQEQL